jgi:hypothetical protein
MHISWELRIDPRTVTAAPMRPILAIEPRPALQVPPSPPTKPFGGDEDDAEGNARLARQRRHLNDAEP